MGAKSEADLALTEKKDVARTFTRLKHRILANRELNNLEDLIEKNHNAEVANGGFSQIDVDSLTVGNLAKELPSGEADTDSATDSDD